MREQTSQSGIPQFVSNTARLKGGGHLIVEISPMIETAVNELLSQDGRYAQITTVRDLAQRPRVVWARRT